MQDTHSPLYYLGMPMWNHRQWQGAVYPSGSSNKQHLQAYASVFNTVEGNTSFYATPSEEKVRQWAEQVTPGFRFSFKLPRQITHELKLRNCAEVLSAFLSRMEGLGDNLGPFMIQLPEAFGPSQLGDLKRFLDECPQVFRYSVEVRNHEFFNRGEEEKALNQLLQSRNVDRVCFDSRALFSLPAVTPADKDAQAKKPRLPVHAIATSDAPLLRFIGSANEQHNQQYWQPWVAKLSEWISQGKTPFVFIHTPDNADAPQLAQLLHNQLKHLPGWQPLPLQQADKPGDEQLVIF